MVISNEKNEKKMGKIRNRAQDSKKSKKQGRNTSRNPQQQLKSNMMSFGLKKPGFTFLIERCLKLHENQCPPSTFISFLFTQSVLLLLTEPLIFILYAIDFALTVSPSNRSFERRIKRFRHTWDVVGWTRLGMISTVLTALLGLGEKILRIHEWFGAENIFHQPFKEVTNDGLKYKPLLDEILEQCRSELGNLGYHEHAPWLINLRLAVLSVREGLTDHIVFPYPIVNALLISFVGLLLSTFIPLDSVAQTVAAYSPRLPTILSSFIIYCLTLYGLESYSIHLERHCLSDIPSVPDKVSVQIPTSPKPGVGTIESKPIAGSKHSQEDDCQDECQPDSTLSLSPR